MYQKWKNKFFIIISFLENCVGEKKRQMLEEKKRTENNSMPELVSIPFENEDEPRTLAERAKEKWEQLDFAFLGKCVGLMILLLFLCLFFQKLRKPSASNNMKPDPSLSIVRRFKSI